MNINDVKTLREETGAGLLEAKQTLEKYNGDFLRAKEELLKRGILKAEKKADRITKDGLVHAYVHTGGKLGSMVVVACETDFVAKTVDFQNLCHELALQACTEEYNNLDELLNAAYIKDPNKKISDLIKETIAKVGEKIEIKKFARFSVL